jgi:hypothetical protein
MTDSTRKNSAPVADAVLRLDCHLGNLNLGLADSAVVEFFDLLGKSPESVDWRKVSAILKALWMQLEKASPTGVRSQAGSPRIHVYVHLGAAVEGIRPDVAATLRDLGITVE